MTTRTRLALAAPLAALLLGACASSGGELATSGLAPQPPAKPAVETVSRLPAGGAYQLTATERALDCRTLTGRMAVRIVQIRDFENRRQATALSRSLQSATSPVLGGGSTAGLDPDGRYARDRAQLDAYNTLLAEKSCANFDLETELDPAAKGPPRVRRT